MTDPATSTDPSSTPYDGLTPDAICAALEGVGFEPNGSLLALNSFENRVYQVGCEDGSFVVAKFYRPGRWSRAQIQEEHDFTRELVEAELSVVAPLARDGETLFEGQGFLFAVFPRQGGHPPEIESEHNLAIMGRTLGRLHACGSARTFSHRTALDWREMGQASRDWLLASDFIPSDLVPAYESTSEHLLAAIETRMDTPHRSLRLHGDCHLGNVLWRDDVPHFVDFDDTRSGPAIQDLWMLLSGDHDERSRQFRTLIEAYETFARFDTIELGLIESLRTLRMMHHAAWIGRRWNDPAFPPAFPWFDGGRYWSDHVLSLREQLAALDEPPLSV
ncbi:MAG: serine/threonine protein kinase [Pseudomonadota bacterium]